MADIVEPNPGMGLALIAMDMDKDKNKTLSHRLRLPLIGSVLVVLAATWSGIAYQLHQLRGEALGSAERQGENITAVVAEHFLLFAGTVDGTLRHLRAQWMKEPRHFSEIVHEHVALAEDTLNQIVISDANGVLIYPPARAGGAPVSVADRDYFQALRNGSGDALYVGRPVLGRISGKIGVPFAIALRNRAGRFRGVMMASIATDKLVHSYKSIDLGPSGFITLRHADGTVVVRSTDLEQMLGGPRPEWAKIDTPGASGSYVRAGRRDGIERIYSYRRLSDYSFIAVAGQGLDGALARWYEQRRMYVAGGMLMSLVLLLLVSVTVSKLRHVERTERDLRESENRYRTLTGLSADWYWELDQECRFLALTPNTASARAGERVARHLGRRPWDMPYADANRDDWRRYRGLLEARRPFRDVILAATGASGRTIYLNVRGHPVYDGAGAFKGFRGISKDVTQRKRAERLLELEHAVNRSLAAAEDASAALKAVIRDICEAEGWECGRFWRVDEDANVLRFGEAWGIENQTIQRFLQESRDATFAPGEGMAGSVWQSHEPICVADIDQDPRATRALAHRFGIHGAFVFPATSGGRVIGVFGFASNRVREPDERLLQAARVIGGQIGQFVQRKRAEEVLRESEGRFRSLLELSSDMYWEQDEEFRFTSFNGTGSSRPGERHHQRLGKKRWDQDYVNMSADDWAAHRAALEARRPFRDLELCRVDESGAKSWTSVSGQPEFDASGVFRGYRGVGKDITARKREEQLRTLEHSVNRDLSNAADVQECLTAVIRTVCESEAWDCGRYFAVDEKERVLRYGGAWGVADAEIQRFIEAARKLVFRPGEGLSGSAWESGQPIWSNDVIKDPRSLAGHGKRTMASAIGMHGTFVFPVVADGRIIGVLNFSSRRAREREERLVAAIRVIGGQIGQFVQRKLAEEAQRRFRTAIDASADLMLLIDRVTLRYIDVNDAACRALGYSRAELLTMSPRELFSQSGEDLAAQYERMFADGEGATITGVYRCKDGSRLPVEAYPRAVRSAAGDVIVSIERDIRERKRAEDLLRLEHSVTRCLAEGDNASGTLRTVIQTVCEADAWDCGRYFGVDEKAGVLRLAEAWSAPGEGLERFIARSRELTYTPGTGLIGEVWQSGKPLWIPDLAKDARVQAGVARDIGMHGAFFFLVESKGKTIGLLSFHSRDVREPEERLLRAFSVIGSQIGQFLQRKQAEEVTRESEARFRSLTHLSSDMYWEQDDEFRFTLMSGSGSEHVSRTSFPERGAKRWERHYDNMTQEDWAKHIALLEAHQPFRDLELCRVDASGERIWISSSGEPVFDDSGAFRGYRGVGKDITGRKRAEEKLAYLAQFDSLTGLPNRHLFRDRLEQAMARAKRTNKPMAVLFIDLDRFKLINDTLGHSAGDRLLKEATQRLQSCVRASDTIGRFGGDEFGAVITDLTKPGDASVVAQKIIDALAQPFHLDGHESYVTASIGITLSPADGEDAGMLIMNADAAMYRAKEQGRNTYQYFTREMNERAMQRVTMESALRRAIERKEFLLHYQPKVKISSGEVCGFEALLRWQHPERGLVPPLQFVPVLEDTGLIAQVGEWIIGEVCEQIARWREAGLRPLSVAVNLSARQFQQKGLEETVRDALRRTGIDPEMLQFELTESLLMKEPEVAARTLRGLKELGVSLAVDDFGTGYSSLSYLKRFPIDALKIDRAFIRDVTLDPDDAAITLAIIGLAHSLKLSVIAEGVETPDQLEFLETHGCDEMQGFLFSRPVPAEQCVGLLQDERAPRASRRRAAGASSGSGPRRLPVSAGGRS